MDAPRITPEELNERMQAGQEVVVLDVRRAAYAESDVKILGAVRIDPDRLEQEYGRLAPGSNVVAYCT